MGIFCSGKNWFLETRYWYNRILKVAKQYETKAFFAISNEAVFDQELEDFGLKKNGERLVGTDDQPMIAADTNRGRYRMETNFSVENFAQFVQSVLDNQIEKFMKSEDEVTNSDNFVKVVVNKNFDQIVLNSPFNVFLMLFSPICGICRRLSVKLDELDQQFINEDIIFAKMDIMANDIPPLFTDGLLL
ncbi:unnamed protein product [Enterobius vermicularis]|uniref:protein disulfide-isomerase n=1 Tax=Enterobius vermicularis TaxID=51028 RepID=A0A0N4VPL1_ENTVE|nr:unnamed protein product [Enterobius vermicularis]